MDLIYADEKGKELGVLNNFALDVAFGSDENNFELEIDLESHCCKAGYFIYLDGTEYGGIVDKIEPDTEKNNITYKGRTWHGIINGKIIEPEAGQDYRIVSGDANAVIRELIEDIGLSTIFEVSESESAVNIEEYQFDRYTPAYLGILKMLRKNNGKLVITCINGKVMLDAVPLFDYSRDDEWDSSQMGMVIEKNYHPVNHLICLGKGDLRERKVIHLFADENGGVQPYATVDSPYRNEHYILDKSHQVLFGSDEVTEIYDLGNAQDTLNYVLLQNQPDGWKEKYTGYYRKTDGDFKLLEREYEDAYTQLSSEPVDWSRKYGNYFYKNGNSYKNVEGTEKSSYNVLKTKPSDWKKNYGNYFYLWSDGVTSEYRSVSGDSKDKYVIQTMKPSDWKENYSKYYEYIPTLCLRIEVLEKDKNGVWQKHYEIRESADDLEDTSKKKYRVTNTLVRQWVYQKISDKKAPAWKSGKYYTKQSYSVAPKWKEKYYFSRAVTTVAPVWEAGKYYGVASQEQIPVFSIGKYYELFVDSYADLVTQGLKKMEQYANCDSISSKLDASKDYGINDIVGATELKTGIRVVQPITKKIVKFIGDDKSIEYEIGE